jgi:hypothetical protein
MLTLLYLAACVAAESSLIQKQQLVRGAQGILAGQERLLKAVKGCSD